MINKHDQIKSCQSKGLLLKYGKGHSRFGPYNDYEFLSLFNGAFQSSFLEFDATKNSKRGFYLDKLRTEYFMEATHSKIHQDYYKGSIKQFNLSQIDRRPNCDLKEAKWDLFKITLSDNGSKSTLSKCKTILKFKT